MLHDITYCVAIDCPYRFNCARHADNNKINDTKNNAYCNFKHTAVKCEYFIEKGAEKWI